MAVLSFNNILRTIIQQCKAPKGNHTTILVTGAPGGGKSACQMKAARVLAEEKGIPPERIVVFNPSLRDPVDIMGIPFKSEDGTHSRWLPPEEFWNLRDGVGPCILVLEELSDAPMAMQNPLCRVILDRYAGNLKLSDELIILANGNRVEDRSGANRLSTKLANRLCILEFKESVDDWVSWAKTDGDIKQEVITFIQYRPNLLSDFDPKRSVNPTPRAWESVSRVPEFDDDPDGFLYFSYVAGLVGEGAAHEYCAYRKIWRSLPDFDKLLADPEKYEVPTDLAVLYATVLKLVSTITNKTPAKDVDAALTYINRVAPDLKAMAIRDMMSNKDAFNAVVKSKMFPILSKGLKLGF